MTISPDNKLTIAKSSILLSSGSVIRTTARRKNLLFCVREEPSFHTVTNTSPFVVSRSSIHTVCDKLSERLCKVLGTVVPKACHSRAKGVAQACQRGGTSKAYLLLLVRYAFSALQTGLLQRCGISSKKHAYKRTLYQIVKLE